MLAALQDPEARAAMEQLATEKHDVMDNITAGEKAAMTAREVELNPLHSQATSVVERSGWTGELLTEKSASDKATKEMELKLREKEIETESKKVENESKRVENERLKLELEEKRLEMQAREMENMARKDEDQHHLMLALVAKFWDK